MRRKDREVTNIIEILQIIEKAKVLHLALFDADYPYIVPLHYGYEYTEGGLCDGSDRSKVGGKNGKIYIKHGEFGTFNFCISRMWKHSKK